MAKRRITQITSRDRSGTLGFWHRESRQNSNGDNTNGCAKYRWGRLNAIKVAENWRLSTWSVVNLARSQVYHTQRLPYLFAARSPWCSASHGFVSDSWSLFYVEVGGLQLIFATLIWFIAEKNSSFSIVIASKRQKCANGIQPTCGAFCPRTSTNKAVSISCKVAAFTELCSSCWRF